MKHRTASSFSLRCQEMNHSDRAAATAGNPADVPIVRVAGTVERRPQLTPVEFFDYYVKEKIPVVVSGGFSRSIPVERWTS